MGGSRGGQRQPPRRDAGDRDTADLHFVRPDDARLGRPGVLQRRQQPAVHRAGLRLARHLPAEPRRRRSAARSRPRAVDPGSGRRRPTYAFRIRPGIRYSDGQPLRASDFRRGIERLFRVGSPGGSLYAGLVGAAACARRPASCDLSRGIVTDDAAGTVTFHLTAPDPEFLFKLTEFAFSAPIPPGTPDHETGSRTVPGTGPYKIARVSDTEIRFVRNPFFREWSHAAQPAGNPDSIVWRTVPTAQAAVTAIEHGRADWLFGQIPAAQYHQLELQDPAQLHSSPQFAVEFVPLNTHLAPFNDVRVRQALNYAINRGEIAQLYGGPSFATPTCQPIAPGLPGYRRYCPYTLHPRADGAWSAPDMARARRLVAQSGTLGERVDVWGSPDEGFVPPTTAAYIASVLRALGYRVHLHLVPLATITEAMGKRIQLSVDGDWVANYPDPSSYLPQFFGCGGGNQQRLLLQPGARPRDATSRAARTHRSRQGGSRLGIHRPPAHRRRRLGADRDRARRRTHVSAVCATTSTTPSGDSSPTRAGSDNPRPQPFRGVRSTVLFASANDYRGAAGRPGGYLRVGLRSTNYAVRSALSRCSDGSSAASAYDVSRNCEPDLRGAVYVRPCSGRRDAPQCGMTVSS